VTGNPFPLEDIMRHLLAHAVRHSASALLRLARYLDTVPTSKPSRPVDVHTFDIKSSRWVSRPC